MDFFYNENFIAAVILILGNVTLLLIVILSIFNFGVVFFCCRCFVRLWISNVSISSLFVAVSNQFQNIACYFGVQACQLRTVIILAKIDRILWLLWRARPVRTSCPHQRQQRRIRRLRRRKRRRARRRQRRLLMQRRRNARRRSVRPRRWLDRAPRRICRCSSARRQAPPRISRVRWQRRRRRTASRRPSSISRTTITRPNSCRRWTVCSSWRRMAKASRPTMLSSSTSTWQRSAATATRWKAWIMESLDSATRPTNTTIRVSNFSLCVSTASEAKKTNHHGSGKASRQIFGGAWSKPHCSARSRRRWFVVGSNYHFEH